MFNVFRKMMDMLNRRERFQFSIVVIVVIFAGVSDMIGVATILPFLSVVTEPSSIHDNAILSRLYAWSGARDEMQFVFYMGVGIFTVIMLGLVIKTGSLYAAARFGHMRKYHISNRLMAAYLRQPYTWFLSRHSAELTKSVLLDVDHMIGTALLPAMQILMQIVSIVLLVGLLFYVEPVVAAVTAVFLGGLYLLIYFSSHKTLQGLGQTVIECDSARYRTMNEALGGIKEVKLGGLERDYLIQFQSPSRRHAEALIKKQMISEMPRHILEGVTFGGMVLLILFFLQRSGGSLNEILPMLGLFTLAGLRLLPAIQRVYANLAIVKAGNAVLKLVHTQIMSLREEGAGDFKIETNETLPLKSAMSFEQVTYTYPSTERNVVDGLDLRIEANTSVGIVGGTGAGKTTTVDIILGLLRPQTGRVVVDGVTLGPENLRRWQNNLGYVPQQIFLIDDTITANITYGVAPDDVDLARVEQVARLAELHGFVMTELPEGYDTNVGERGVRLSGGQRQRIGIARALYHDPDILIMDEATSALDNITERSVMKAVQNLGGKKTVIMIAHRLTTVRNCDKILFLEHGKVADSGTYDELLESNETFREMAKEVE